MGKLNGKVAIITGAASGMGRATAILFTEEGARVTVADCAVKGGWETVEMIKEAGGEATFIEVDVSKAEQVKHTVKTTVDTYGRADILFNNAGITGSTIRTARYTEEEWDRVLGVNLKGVFLGSKYIIPVMQDQGGGVIINTASTGGMVGLPYQPAYCASKAGVIFLTKTMVLEYGRDNIRVNCICPGPIHTAMTEPWLPTDPADRQAHLQSQLLGRWGKPEAIAKAALYLASDDAAYITGTALVVDGGWTAGSTTIR